MKKNREVAIFISAKCVCHEGFNIAVNHAMVNLWTSVLKEEREAVRDEVRELQEKRTSHINKDKNINIS